MASCYLDADIDPELKTLLGTLGHDVLTTYEMGRKYAGDEEQLAFAAQLGRTFVTHNADDFELLQRAWRHWPDVWGMQSKPTHAGILTIPQSLLASLEQSADAIDALVRSRVSLTNRFYEWSLARGWILSG